METHGSSPPPPPMKSFFCIPFSAAQKCIDFTSWLQVVQSSGVCQLCALYLWTILPLCSALFCSVLRTSCSWRQQLVDSTPLLRIATTTTLDCLGPWTFGRHSVLPQVMRAEQNEVDPNVLLAEAQVPTRWLEQ